MDSKGKPNVFGKEAPLPRPPIRRPTCARRSLGPSELRTEKPTSVKRLDYFRPIHLQCHSCSGHCLISPIKKHHTYVALGNLLRAKSFYFRFLDRYTQNVTKRITPPALKPRYAPIPPPPQRERIRQQTRFLHR
ncbi:hypothetical protein J6590_058930 [Homalodisca vitripennis]|nr:hypothetical protein J6590_058930 [Homalodisca vitripennis]